MKRTLLITMVAVLASFVAHSQSMLTGTVLDENQVPLPGATVVVKGTSNGVATDFDGNFSIELTGSNDILLVSYIGYIKQEVDVTAKKRYNIFHCSPTLNN